MLPFPDSYLGRALDKVLLTGISVKFSPSLELWTMEGQRSSWRYYTLYKIAGVS